MEKYIKNFLSSLAAGKRDIVFVSVSAGLGLEMIKIDKDTNTVSAYGYRPLAYNDTMREIADYAEFKKGLDELFAELKISPKSTICLSLPMVFWGKISLPLILNDENVSGAIVSEVEKSYLFKKSEPVISWFDIPGPENSESRTILYSAVQKDAIDTIQNIITEFGANLKIVENSVISILRGLYFANLTPLQMADNVSWNLMIINSFGYSIISMSGQNIVDYYEEPIAFKTYGLEEVYDAINASAQIALMSFPANYLYIISETDLVSSEHLASKIQTDGTTNCFEDNSFRKSEIIPVTLDVLPDYIPKISLKAVGLGALMIVDYPIKINFLGNGTFIGDDLTSEPTLSFMFNDKEVVLTESMLKSIVGILFAIILIPAILSAYVILPNIEKGKKAELDKVNNEIQTIEAEIKKLTDTSSGSFDVKTEIEKVLKNNRTKLISYSALGESVPRNLWLTYFKTQDDGKINVQGVSDDVEGIYKFYKNMKDSLIDSNLRLQKLEMQSSSIEDVVSSGQSTNYNFEITNMAEEISEEAQDGDSKSNVKNDSKDGDKKESKKSEKNKDKDIKNLEPVDESSLK